MGASLKFAASMDDSQFEAGLRRMENKAANSGRKVGEGLNRGMTHSTGQIRPLGDVLDVVTGQYGGVMKMNAAVHTLGLSLGTAFGAVGVAMLGQKIYEDTEKVRELHLELKKIQNLNFGAAASSMSDLQKTITEGQSVKEKAQEMAGTKPGQSWLSRFGRSAMNMAADVLDVSSWGDTLHGRNHAKKQEEIAAAAQVEQQNAVGSISKKMGEQVQIQSMLNKGNTQAAKLKQEELSTNEELGDVMKLNMGNQVNGLAMAAQVLAGSEERKKQILGQTFDQQRKNERETQKVAIQDQQKAKQIREDTARKTVEDLQKHDSLRSRMSGLRKDITRQSNLIGAPHSELWNAEHSAARQESISQAREIGAQRAMTTPMERANADRDQLRMRHAADRAERIATRGMDSWQKHEYQAQQKAAKDAAHKGGVTAKLDKGDISQLAQETAKAVEKLVLK